MPNNLPLPPDLQFLVEKRDSTERRKKSRRTAEERRSVDLGPLGAIESSPDLAEIPLEDRRAGTDRRRKTTRRLSARRKGKSRKPKG